MNARIFLGAPVPRPDDPEFELLFEEFVDLVLCRHGSAIKAERAWHCLRLHGQRGPFRLDWIQDRLAEGRPVGLSARSSRYGFHNVLCIYANNRTVRLVNWEKDEEVVDILFEDLKTYRCALYEGSVAFALRE
jgi:hypothetical protein